MTSKQYVDQLHYTAYCNKYVSVHTRLYARDMLRQIREGTFTYPDYVRVEGETA